jgi:hypothetical protein
LTMASMRLRISLSPYARWLLAYSRVSTPPSLLSKGHPHLVAEHRREGKRIRDLNGKRGQQR